MAYNPFDDVIDSDPAYMQTGGETYRQPNAPGGLRPQEALTKKGGPVIEKLREQFPNFDNLQDEYLDKSAQSLSKVVSPIYNFLGMGTDKYNEAKQLDKAILQDQQIQFEEKPKPGSLEEGRMIKESAPAYMDFLKEQGYTGNTNILRELQNFVVVPQMKVFNKLAKGEALYSELSSDEKMFTDPLLVGLDMLDLAGLSALATKGFRQPFINFVTNAKKNNVPIQKIVEDTSKLFPEDTQKAATFFFGEQKGVNFKPLTEDGTGSATPTGYGSKRAKTRNYLETLDEPQTVEQIAKALDLKPSAVQDFKYTFANDPITQMIRKKDPKNIPEERVVIEGGGTQKINEFLNKQKEPLTQQQIADAVGVKRQVVANYKYELDKNSPLLKLFRSDKPEGQTELLKNLFEENPNLIFKNKKELTDKYNISSTTLKNFILANPQYNKNFGAVGAVVSQGNAGLTDVLRTSNRTLNQKLTQLEEFIATNKEETINTLYKKFGFGDSDPQTNRPLMSIKTFSQYMRNQKGYVSQKQTQKSLFSDYFPQSYGMNKPDKIRADTTMTQDFFRSDFFKDNNEFVSVMKGFGIEPKTITNEAGIRIPNPDWNLETNKIKKQNFYNAQASILTQKNGYDKLLKKSADANALSRDVSQKFYDSLRDNEGFRNQFISEYNRVFPKGSKAHVPDNNWEEMYKKYKSQFTAQLAHITPLKDFKKLEGFKGMGAEPDLLTINFGAHNVAVQPRIENVIKDAVRNINQGRDIEKNLTRLRNANSYMVNNNMRTYLRFTDRTMSDETLKKLQDALGDVYIGKDNNQKTIFLGRDEEMTLEEMKSLFSEKMFQYIADPKSFRISTGKPLGAKMEDEMLITGSAPYIKKGAPLDFKKGGPVKMAIGGNPLENINEQQFASDPATDDDFFKQAVQDENLMAFNPFNLFKVFRQSPAVSTPNKVVGSVATDAPTGTLPAATKIDMDDFPFQSHFINTISDRNIPSMDTPQGWRNLFGGTKGFSDAELKDSGILGYLEDAEKFLPGAKVSKEDLLKVYEKSPIANLEIKVKTEVPVQDTLPISGDYKNYTGTAQHKNMGNAEIDKGGTDYRNIVINVKEIPGQQTPFFNTGHFADDPNVIAFTRVANYKNTTGNDVAVIQELQTDLITNLRKEQERLNATVNAVRNKKRRLTESMERFPDDPYSKQQLDRLNAQYPEEKLRFLENTDLTRPPNPEFLETLAPDLVRQLNDIQNQINKLTMENVGVVRNPQYVNQIKELQDKGLSIFNDLFDLNRQKNFDDNLQDTFVSDVYRSEDLAEIGRNSNVPADRPVESYGQIPFSKGPDWIDLMLKATIQDAQSRGINKVAIMPSDVVNKRWSKDADGSAGEKFQTIYDKISVQELKNIAKKYTGNKANLQIEEIVDPNKGQQGFRVLEKGVDGKYENLRELDPNTTFPNRGPEDTSDYNYDILKLAQNYDFGEIIIRKEIAPGQSMDYAIKIKKAPVDKETGLNFNIDVEDTFDLVPAKEGVDPLVVIEEFNPSVTKMYVLTLPEETTKKGPMFLFRKKDGGKIKSDGLVSITDIYGDY